MFPARGRIVAQFFAQKLMQNVEKEVKMRRLMMMNLVELFLQTFRISVKWPLVLILACTLCSSIAVGAWGDSSMKPRVQCVEGTWTGERAVINQYGVQKVWAVLEIGKVEEHMLHGTYTWQLLDGVGGNDGESFVIGDTEEVLGAIDHRGREFYLAESPESGIYRGRMIGRNEIELFLIQSGAFPVVGFSAMSREGSPPEGCR